jgi:hypothetical protein
VGRSVVGVVGVLLLVAFLFGFGRRVQEHGL